MISGVLAIGYSILQCCNHRIYTTAILSACLCACGGGGSSNTSSLVYTGNITAVHITDNNANLLFANLLLDSSSLSINQVVAVKSVTAPHSLDIVRSLNNVSKQHAAQALTYREQLAPLITSVSINETSNCNTAGTIKTSGNIKEDGTGVLNLSFSDCDDGDGVVMSGKAVMEVDAFDLVTEEITDGTLRFTKLSLISADGNLIIDGIIHDQVALSENQETLTINAVYVDNVSSKQYKLEDLVSTSTYDNFFTPSSFSEKISGRFYDSIEGYVDISTEIALQYSDATLEHPDVGGLLIIAGAESSKARLLVLSSGQVRIEVDSDGDGSFETSNNYSWSDFSTAAAPDLTPPTVLSTNPVTSGSAISINISITATFSKPMDPTTITAAEFTLMNGLNSVSGTVTYSGTTATFTPAAPLTFDTQYTAMITTGVRDLSDNAMTSTYVWSFTSVVAPFTPNPSPLPPLNQAVAYQNDYAHSGYVTFGVPLTFPANPTWSVNLDGAVSYPLIAEGKVFVTTADLGSGHGTQLYALDKQTGVVVWGPLSISGNTFWSGLAYDHGKVFVINFDGLLISFDAATGQAEWSTTLPVQYSFTSPPTAVNGVVYVGGSGSGGTLYAVDESNGHLIWTQGVVNGDQSSPAVSSDGVFVTYPCQAYKFDPFTGESLWHYSGPCSGGGGRTSAYANGLLYMRDWSSTFGLIFDASTGIQIGNFSESSSAPIPAFTTQTEFFQNSGTLQGIDLATRSVLWSFTGDGNLISAPIVIDQVVVVGSTSGNVYAVDAVTGSQIWSGSAGATIVGPDEQNVSQPLTGFGAGEGYLVVPAGNVLTAWHLVP